MYKLTDTFVLMIMKVNMNHVYQNRFRLMFFLDNYLDN